MITDELLKILRKYKDQDILVKLHPSASATRRQPGEPILAIVTAAYEDNEYPDVFIIECAEDKEAYDQPKEEPKPSGHPYTTFDETKI